MRGLIRVLSAVTLLAAAGVLVALVPGMASSAPEPSGGADAAGVLSDRTDRTRSSTAKADTVFKHGVVYTVTSKSTKSALAVRDGRIVFVGHSKGVKKYIGPDTDVVDLKGRMLMPGLEDHHIHALSGGRNLLACSLGYAALTRDEMLTAIQGCLDDTSDKEPDGWLSVVSWNVQAMEPEGFVPSRQDLDTLDTDRPIIVNGSDGHASLANSRALDIAGITRDTPDPPDGRILRDANGDPTGVLADGAQGLVRQHIPPPTAEDNLAAFKAGTEALNEQGVTSIWTPDRTWATAEAARTLRDNGDLTVRTNLGYWADGELTAQENLEQAEVMKAEFADDHLTPEPGLALGTVKLAADGINQYPAQTGAMLEPYRENIGTDDDPLWVPSTNFGELYWPARMLYPLVQTFDAAGWQVHTHCVGDRCTRTALDAYEYALDRNGRSDNRHTIVHIDLCHPSDYKRFKKLGVVASMSFQWAQRDPFFLDASRDYMGDERWRRQFPGGSLFRNGATIAAGSDWPVDPLNEWLAMELAVTRTGPLPGKYSKPLNASEGIPLWEAIRANTLNSAYQMHQDDVTGSLERGKFADLIVLDQNILKVPIKRVSDTQVEMTMVGGEVVYEK